MNMGFLSVPNLSDQICWITLHLTLDRKVTKGREDGKRGGGRWRLFEEGD